MSIHVVATFVLIAHWLLIVSLSARVVMRRPPVGVSLAWLAIVYSVPFVGAAIYLLFGERQLGHERAARINASFVHVARWQEALRARYDKASTQLDALARPLSRQAERIPGFPVLPGNDIELLGESEAIFDRLIADIDSAQKSVHAGFYVWHEGGRANDVVDALIRTAERGIQCRLLAIAVIDDRGAYSCSHNLVDPQYLKQSTGTGEWIDAMVRIQGPAVAALDAVFRLDWSVETGSLFEPPLAHSASPAMPTG